MYDVPTGYVNSGSHRPPILSTSEKLHITIGNRRVVKKVREDDYERLASSEHFGFCSDL